LLNTTIEQMWLHELNLFDVEYGKYAEHRRVIQSPEAKTSVSANQQKKKLIRK